MNFRPKRPPRFFLLFVLAASVLLTTACAQSPTADAGGRAGAPLSGKIQCAGDPVAGSTVTLYAANEGQSTQLGQTKTGDDGAFRLDVGSAPPDKVLYLVARGGTPKAPGAKGPNAPSSVIVNEFTTVASAFTTARFIQGESISGNPLGLRIAAMNVPNLANPQTGG